MLNQGKAQKVVTATYETANIVFGSQEQGFDSRAKRQFPCQVLLFLVVLLTKSLLSPSNAFIKIFIFTFEK